MFKHYIISKFYNVSGYDYRNFSLFFSKFKMKLPPVARLYHRFFCGQILSSSHALGLQIMKYKLESASATIVLHDYCVWTLWRLER